MGITWIKSNNEILGNVRNLIGVLCEVTGKMGIGLEYPKVEQPHFRLVQFTQSYVIYSDIQLELEVNNYSVNFC